MGTNTSNCNSKKFVAAHDQYNISFNILVNKIKERISSASEKGHNTCEVSFTGEFADYDLVLDYFKNLGYRAIENESDTSNTNIDTNTKPSYSNVKNYKIYWGPNHCDSFAK